MHKLSKLQRFSAVIAISAIALTACGSGSTSAGSNNSSAGASNTSKSGKKVRIALIMKDQSNPYWFSMADAGRTKAKELGVDLIVSAAKDDSDTQSQITAVNSAIADKLDGIIIAVNGPAVNASLKQAKAAGLTVMAVDTVPTPPDLVDATYGTPNLQAGKLIGQYAAAKLHGKAAKIALLDAYNNQVVSVDVDRDHGFLEGMGIPVGDPNINGKEPKSGKYTGGNGGTYEIVCQAATIGAQAQGQNAMNTCLTKNPGINVVYTINEQAAQGAIKAIENVANIKDITVVSIDGGCQNLQFVASGAEVATAGQRPDLMTADAIEGILKKVIDGVTPKFGDAAQRFINSGTYLITDSPLPSNKSVTTSQAKSTCWGSK